VNLKTKKCLPCTASTPALNQEELQQLREQVPNWMLDIIPQSTLKRSFKFKDFVQAMFFVNQVAELAEAEGHHPNISIAWNKVELALTTHAIRNLSENDFILATKIDHLAELISAFLKQRNEK
jgi:4a-hydroxytetrahydrobiopterin dehydratase